MNDTHKALPAVEIAKLLGKNEGDVSITPLTETPSGMEGRYVMAHTEEERLPLDNHPYVRRSRWPFRSPDTSNVSLHTAYLGDENGVWRDCENVCGDGETATHLVKIS